METDLTIKIVGAGEAQDLAKLLDAAMEMAAKNQPAKTSVPPGYRCVECYAGDGNHAPTCSIPSTLMGHVA